MAPRIEVPTGCTWPIILGIDPGTIAVGYGAVVQAPDGMRLLSCGVIQARAQAPVAERLGQILGELELIMSEVQPTLVVVESAFTGRNPKSALRIGEGRGLALAAAARYGAPVVEMPPAVAKKAVVGTGRATKEQVAAMVETLLASGPLDVPLDATDALSLAIAQVHRMGVLETT